jgi:poly [ADP-ribose] polymerase
VSVDNGLTAQSNKVYIMEEQSDGTIKCEYGRVGKNLVTVFKQSHEWDKVLNSKTNPRKGYKDVTDMITVATTSGSTANTKTVDISCNTVKRLFDDLMAYANKSIQRNYKVTQDAVTQAQIDAAQEVLTKAVQLVKVGVKPKQINDLLIELYTIIPRKMQDVRDYLVGSADDKNDVSKINDFLANEQDTLDTMAGQVQLIAQQTTSTDADDLDGDGKITLLEQMGLKVEIETDKTQLELINRLLGSTKDRAQKIFKCTNLKTQKLFDKEYGKKRFKDRKLFWHGSRNENWFNIMQSGLLIRPSGAVHTGSMWDDGIYFASDADKSMGYTNGGRWAGGSRSNSIYMALYVVYHGKQLVKDRHDSSCYNISQEVKRGGYDSVHAKKGPSLRKDEFIIYNSNQCTISYLIEFEW